MNDRMSGYEEAFDAGAISVIAGAIGIIFLLMAIGALARAVYLLVA